MEGKIFIDGREVGEETALVSVFDLGFMYGATFMEAIRTFTHTPFRMEEHLARLVHSIQAAGITLSITREEMHARVMQAFDAYLPEIEEDNDCWVCINITPGRTFPHPLVKAEKAEPTVIVYAVPLPYSEYVDYYSRGVPAYIATVRNTSPQTLSPRIKVRSRMHYFMAKVEVKKIDPNAVPLLLDINGYLSEGSGANIFLVIDGELHTPAIDNILEGISRRTVIEIAGRLDIPVRERNIQLLDIRSADEAFFTTTSYSILPINRIDREKPLHVPGPVTGSLLKGWGKKLWTLKSNDDVLLVHPSFVEAHRKRLLEFLADFHRKNPRQLGPEAQILLRVIPGLPEKISQEFLREMESEGLIKRGGVEHGLADHQGGVSDEDREKMDALLDVYGRSGFKAPDRAAVAKYSELIPRDVRDFTALLIEEGDLVRVTVTDSMDWDLMGELCPAE